MTPEEKRQGAFEELDELLSKGVSLHDAVTRAAEDNELRPDNFRVIAEKELGALEERASKMRLRALNDAISAEVRLASSKRRPRSLIFDCYDPDEVAAAVERRIGRNLTEDEFPKIHEARRDFVHRRTREFIARLG